MRNVELKFFHIYNIQYRETSESFIGILIDDLGKLFIDTKGDIRELKKSTIHTIYEIGVGFTTKNHLVKLAKNEICKSFIAHKYRENLMTNEEYLSLFAKFSEEEWVDSMLQVYSKDLMKLNGNLKVSLEQHKGKIRLSLKSPITGTDFKKSLQENLPSALEVTSIKSVWFNHNTIHFAEFRVNRQKNRYQETIKYYFESLFNFLDTY